MSNTVYYDVVADGMPQKFDRVEVAFLAVFILLGLWEMHNGRWWEAFDTGLFAMFVYLIGKTRQKFWLMGYESAMKTTAEQMNSEIESADKS